MNLYNLRARPKFKTCDILQTTNKPTRFYLVLETSTTHTKVQSITASNGLTIEQPQLLTNNQKYAIIMSKYKNTKLNNFKLETLIIKQKLQKTKTKFKNYKIGLLESFLDKLGARISSKITKKFEGTHDKEAKQPICPEVR